jgi:hypothetical protein
MFQAVLKKPRSPKEKALQTIHLSKQALRSSSLLLPHMILFPKVTDMLLPPRVARVLLPLPRVARVRDLLSLRLSQRVPKVVPKAIPHLLSKVRRAACPALLVLLASYLPMVRGSEVSLALRPVGRVKRRRKVP